MKTIHGSNRHKGPSCCCRGWQPSAHIADHVNDAVSAARLQIPVPYKVIQTPGLIAMLFEADNTRRQVYTDRREPVVDPQPAWLGYSTGKWAGDTLIVDTVGFNDRVWLDAFGHPQSEASHVTERIHRRDF